MRIFVSYSHTQRDLAAQLVARLRAAGYAVFHDESSLPKGQAYDAVVAAQIRGCHLFVFLLTPESVRPGCYALTELGFAEARWPNPARGVLPVMAADTRPEVVPPYLSSVSIFKPRGQLVAEVLDEIATWRRRRRGGLLRRAGLAAVAVMAATGLVAVSWPTDHFSPDASPTKAQAETSPADAAQPMQGQEHTQPRPVRSATSTEKPVREQPSNVLWRKKGCSAQVELSEGTFWLVCRCVSRQPGDGSVPLTSDSLRQARIEALAYARRRDWKCS